MYWCRDVSVADDVPDLREDQEVETVVLGHIRIDGRGEHEGHNGGDEKCHLQEICQHLRADINVKYTQYQVKGTANKGQFFALN